MKLAEGGDAIDCGHDRKRQRTQLADQRVVEIFLRSADDVFVRLGQAVAEVLSGAEGASRAGEQQRAAGCLCFGLRQRSVERRQHGFVAGVQPLRSVKRDDAIAFAQFHQDRCFIHAGFPGADSIA
jgi:hypothetical protein